MENNQLELKSIYEVLEYNFFIPSYQRGYKWDSQQIIELLNDISEFAQKKSRQEIKKEEFYCLQPIVVLKDNNKYRVIDGQQRLTTIYIILKYLEDLLNEEYDINNYYSIEYETRKNSKEFLEKDLSENLNKENPDFYYMSNAYKTIKEWFKEKTKQREISKRKFLEVLLGLDEKDVKFIWYELDKSEDEIKVFTRLNIGKIPLSNSELIKALLLYERENNEKREIISFWDNIEKTLQNDRFFNFITKEKYKNTRIDFIFNLIAKKEDINNFNQNDKRYSFYVFDYLIKTGKKSQKDLWNEVKDYFRIFEELYNNNTYYHYVGFLINSEKIKIDEIIKLFKENNKDEFKIKLIEKMKIEIQKDFKELSYDEDNEEIYKLLFLFNVIITENSGYSRYPFDIHNKENWSLEHIHAQNSENITKTKDMKIILEAQLDYVNDEVKKQINELLELKKIEKSEFDNLQNKIFKQFSDEIDIHTIDNLALLSKSDNSSLSNSIFPAKRDKIKQLDENGKFIPLGTKNVFMKYYSNNVRENLTWNKEDRINYLKELEDKLKEFKK